MSECKFKKVGDLLNNTINSERTRKGILSRRSITESTYSYVGQVIVLLIRETMGLA